MFKKLLTTLTRKAAERMVGKTNSEIFVGPATPANERPTEEQKPDNLLVVFKNAADMLIALKAEYNYEAGFRDGFAYHSTEAYNKSVDNCESDFRMIMDYFIEEFEADIHQSQKDMVRLQPGTESALELQLHIENLEIKRDRHGIEKMKEHKTDKTSRCYAIISAYTRGYNAGQQKYLLTRGLK